MIHIKFLVSIFNVLLVMSASFVLELQSIVFQAIFLSLFIYQ